MFSEFTGPPMLAGGAVEHSSVNVEKVKYVNRVYQRIAYATAEKHAKGGGFCGRSPGTCRSIPGAVFQLRRKLS
jgi:hypothetical protein